jgi:hypothetical protein
MLFLAVLALAEITRRVIISSIMRFQPRRHVISLSLYASLTMVEYPSTPIRLFPLVWSVTDAGKEREKDK